MYCRDMEVPLLFGLEMFFLKRYQDCVSVHQKDTNMMKM